MRDNHISEKQCFLFDKHSVRKMSYGLQYKHVRQSYLPSTNDQYPGVLSFINAKVYESWMISELKRSIEEKSHDLFKQTGKTAQCLQETT